MDLYVGVSSNFNNFGNNTTVRLHFDQGATGGNHNDALDGGGAGVNNGEYRCQITTNSQDPTEMSFNGTSWTTQTPNAFKALAYNFGNALLQAEFKIPLKGGTADDNHSYLNLSCVQELGLQITIYTTNNNGMTFYWKSTNGSTTDATSSPGWIDLLLGVKRSYVTFYGTHGANGDPTVDGNIAGDDAWRGAYRRSLKLTDFAGSTLNAVLYLVDNSTSNLLYAGIRIDDADNDAGDYCQIFQEIDNASLPASGRNYQLDNGAENALIADENAYDATDDRYWSSVSDTWATDAISAGQDARGDWRTDHYEYEFSVARSSLNAQDINVADGALMGFLIKYHDATSNTDYYWDYAPNSEIVQIDENGAFYSAAGWPNLRLGAPYVQVIFPEDGSGVEGIVNVRVHAEDENVDGITSAYCYLESALSDTTWLTRIAQGNEYAGSLDVGALENANDTLIVKVVDDDGITIERLIELTIANGTSAALRPTISLTTPSPGTVVGGTASISFSATAGSGTLLATEISIDGASFISTTTSSTHSWTTTGMTDGSHNIVLRATNSSGLSTTTNAITYIVRNTPSVTLSAPTGGTLVSGMVALQYSNTLVSPATVKTDSLFIDGNAYAAVSSGGSDSLNSTVLTDGSHTLQIKLTDSNDRIAFSELITVLVSNSPSISLNAPQGGAVVSGNLLISYSSAAVFPASIVAESLFVDGAVSMSLSAGEDTLNTTDLPDGEHTIQAKAVDSNGKTVWSTILTVLVRNAPSVILTSPSADSVVSGTLVVTFSASAVAPGSIDSTQIAIDGGMFGATASATSDTIDTRPLTEGAHSVQIRAVDANGRVGLSPIVLFSVRNNPSVTVVAPIPDSVISGTAVFRFIATPIAPATISATSISVDGGAFRATSTLTTDTLDTQNMSEGAHTVQIKATDSSDKHGLSSTVKFVVRNNPSVTLTAPGADSLLSGSVLVRFVATTVAPATVATIAIYVDGSRIDTAATDSAYLWNTLVLSDGKHALQVRLIDSNGKTASSESVIIGVSNTPIVTITAPAETTIVSGVDTVEFGVQYATGASRDTTEISFDGGNWIPTTGSLSHVWRTTDFLDGNHSFMVRATGTNGKTGYSQLRAVLVRNLPSVSITAPLGGVVVKGVDTVRFAASAVSPASIARTEISIDGNAWISCSAGESTFVVTTTDWIDGGHSLQARTIDDFGRIGYSRQVVFKVDNAPTVRLLEPVAGDTLSGMVTVRFLSVPVAPATIATRIMSVDGGMFDTLTADSALIDSRLLTDGSHVVIITIADDHGRIATTPERLFTIDNTAPVIAGPTVRYPSNAPSARIGSSVFVTAFCRDGIAGLSSDSALILRTNGMGSGSTVAVLLDNGQGGDEVAGDNVFTASIPVGTDSTGSIAYTLTATDRLNNALTLQSVIRLDNARPTVDYTIDPVPETDGQRRLHTPYDKLIVKGFYSDRGGSGLLRVALLVHNDTGLHVNTSPIELSANDSLFSRIIHLVEGRNSITLLAIDRAGNRDNLVNSVWYVEPKVTRLIDRSGGTVVNPDSVSCQVPEDALLNGTEITVRKVDALQQPKPLSGALTLLHVAHEFGPHGLTFRKPVTLTLIYTEADLDKNQDGVRDIDPLKLSVVFWDGGTWRVIGGPVVDTLRRSVSVQVNHFSMYDLGVSETPLPQKLKVYWTRNPVSRLDGSTFVFELPSSGKVSCAILDAAGDLVYQLIRKDSDFAAGAHDGHFVWRGENTSGQFSGAGLYVYVFNYKGENGATTVIRKPLGLLR